MCTKAQRANRKRSKAGKPHGEKLDANERSDLRGEDDGAAPVSFIRNIYDVLLLLCLFRFETAVTS